MSGTNDSELSSSDDDADPFDYDNIDIGDVDDDDDDDFASNATPPVDAAKYLHVSSGEGSSVHQDDVVIEYVTGEGLADGELSQFVLTSIPDTVPSSARATTPLPPPSIKTAIPVEQEELLIKKLINGELSFNDYNQQIGHILADQIDDEDDDADDVAVDADDNMETDADAESDATTTGINTSTSAAAAAASAAASTASSSDHFERELLQSRRDAIRGNLQGSKNSKSARRRCVLPTALQGLMGSANLCYARGDIALAEKACLEIIRQVPLAPEPFITLAQIYEHNTDKYMQFSLIAAHLNPNDSDQWIRIAQVSIEQGNIHQAINCYAKASRYNLHDNELRVARIRLLKQIGEDRLAFRVYCSMLGYIPAKQREFLLETAKLVANQWLSDKQPARALDAMTLAYDRLNGAFETADLNFYLELLIEQADFVRVLAVLEHHTGVRAPLLSESDANAAAMGAVPFDIPANIILDFRAKLIVSLIRVRAFHLLDALFADIFAHIAVEDAGDCYLDIAEALIAEQRYADALRLLVPLVRSDNYSLAAVWLRHADCHRAIGNTIEAIDSYRQVVRLAPQHFDARLTLSALLKQLGRHTEAMAALEQDMDSELIDPLVLYERCYMLREVGNWAQFLDTGLLLLSRHGIQLRNLTEMVVAAKNSKLNKLKQMIHECRTERFEPVEDLDGPEFVQPGANRSMTTATAAGGAAAAGASSTSGAVGSGAAAASSAAPTLAAEWQLFQDMMTVACEHRQWPMLLKITLAMTTCKVFASYRAEIWFMCTMASVYNRNAQFSLMLAKEQLERNLSVPRAWNLFAVITQFTDTAWYGRYLFRLFKRVNIQSGPPLLMRANYFLLSGSLKYAINDYVRVYRTCDAPLVPLMLCMTFAHMAQQKHIQKKHSLMVQAMAFATKYRERREREAWHEVQYNLGRLHQALGTVHLAVKHYRNVLEWRGQWSEGEVAERLVGLRQEAAYNLHLLYVQGGNRELARKVLYEHLVI